MVFLPQVIGSPKWELFCHDYEPTKICCKTFRLQNRSVFQVPAFGTEGCHCGFDTLSSNSKIILKWKVCISKLPYVKFLRHWKILMVNIWNLHQRLHFGSAEQLLYIIICLKNHFDFINKLESLFSILQNCSFPL